MLRIEYNPITGANYYLEPIKESRNEKRVNKRRNKKAKRRQTNQG